MDNPNFLSNWFKLQDSQSMEPPPAHSGQRVASMQPNPYQATLDQFELLRQQIQQRNAVQVSHLTDTQTHHQDAAARFHSAVNPDPVKYQMPAVQQRYQEIVKRSSSYGVPDAHALSKQASLFRPCSGIAEHSPQMTSPPLPSPFQPASFGLSVFPPSGSNLFYESQQNRTSTTPYSCSSPATHTPPASSHYDDSLLRRPSTSSIVQAPADSTTKTKRRSGGKKRRPQEETHDPPQANTFVHQQSQPQHQQQQQQHQPVSSHYSQVQTHLSAPVPHHSMLPSAMMGSLEGSGLHIPTFPSVPSLLENPFESAQYSDDMITQMQLANELLGINPQDVVKPEQQHHSMFVSNQNEEAQRPSPTVEDNHGLGLVTLGRSRVKSERSEVDEEFEHLSGEPSKTPLPPVATDNQLTELASPKPPAAKGDSSFQSSFLSFLGGAKQETLSSVTNSAITTKPTLPKYIPPSTPKKSYRKRTTTSNASEGVSPVTAPAPHASQHVTENRPTDFASHQPPVPTSRSKARASEAASPQKKRKSSSSRKRDGSKNASSDDVSAARFAPVSRADFSSYPSSWN